MVVVGGGVEGVFSEDLLSAAQLEEEVSTERLRVTPRAWMGWRVAKRWSLLIGRRG